jgi:poly-gamma-glutamate capsule biosynthesis protein CapA/YwtB (metallophosphatase superfamily)
VGSVSPAQAGQRARFPTALGRTVERLLLAWSLLACALLLVLPGAGRAAPPRAAAPEPEVTLALVGDVMLGRGVARALDGDWGAAFAQVAPWLVTADVAVANLESPLTVRPSSADQDLHAEPAAVAALQAAGFDVVSLANNHALDAGQAGLDETALTLTGAGIAALSAGEEGRSLWDEPVVWALAFDDSDTPLDLPSAAEAIASAARRADAVVVLVHWGGEYQAAPGDRQRAVAQALAEAGADLIVGHGPHTLQPLEWVDGTLVAYSLGNFLFDQPYPLDCRWGAVLQATFDQDGLAGFDIKPTVAERGRVLPAAPAEGVLIGERLGLAPAEGDLDNANFDHTR